MSASLRDGRGRQVSCQPTYMYVPQLVYVFVSIEILNMAPFKYCTKALLAWLSDLSKQVL